MRAAIAVTCALLVSPALPAADPPSDAVLVRRLVDALKDADPDVRQNLATALAKIGPAAVEPLTGALKDGLAERRAGAAYALGLMGGTAKTALADLLELLDDKDVDVRRQAAYAISRVVPTGGTKPPPPPTGDKQ
ncbi:MAG: HEAT repeat domain-containing protein [Gemmataceae bacterium]